MRISGMLYPALERQRNSSSVSSWLVALLYLLLAPLKISAAFCLTTNRAVCLSSAGLYHGPLQAEQQSSSEKSPPATQKRRPGNHNKPNSRAKQPRYSVKKDNAKQSMSQPRPILANYDLNTSPAITQQRLLHESITCEHFQKCSGCSVQNKVGDIPTVQSAKSFFSSPWIRQTMTRRLPSEDDFFKVILPSPLTTWRTQAKLAAAPKSTAWAKDGIQFGLYRTRTHQVVSIPNCAVHHPSINRGIALLEQATAKVGIQAFDEERRDAGLRYIQLQVERTTGKLCLTLVWNAEALKDTQPALSRLVKELNKLDADLWHSLWVNCNDSGGNNVLTRNPNRWHRMYVIV
jgi:hypothetical protein